MSAGPPGKSSELVSPGRSSAAQGTFVLKPVPHRHAFKSQHELLAHALTLNGSTSRALAVAIGAAEFNSSAIATGKTGVGALVEEFFGKPPDNLSQPDFPELGIEMKTLPMKMSGASWTVKEPTSITQIDYFRLLDEAWPDASVREKISHILWVPYEHNTYDKRLAQFRRAFLWQPPETDWPLFGVDYDRVRAEVDAGRAHLLSESMCRFLAPRRKGAKGSTRKQPRSDILAKTRAWAFKPPYTRPILERHVLGKPLVSLLRDLHAIRSLDEFESYVESKLGRYQGMTLAEVALAKNAKIAGGKAGPANFVRNLLDVKVRGEIEEFSKLGIRIHTVWANPNDFRPWEAVSFPRMRLKEFATEDWEDSEFQDHLDRILFIPLLSPTRDARGERRLGRPFFWTPTADEWMGIRREWFRYQQLVRKGAAKYDPVLDKKGSPRSDRNGRPLRSNRLPGYADTSYIHMRPHGENAADEDVDPIGNLVTYQCFWLNPAYLQTILRQHASGRA